MSRCALVTGFEPFGGETLNPSAEIARALHGRSVANGRVVGRVLPCVFGEAAQNLDAWLTELRPEVVVCLGQAGGRTGFSVERVAVNIDDARIPDNAGAQPIDVPIFPEGPVAYWSTLPIKAIVASLRDSGWPASVSQTAGTFVCNHVFYALMHALAGRRAQAELLGARWEEVRGGFVHVPWLPEQPGAAQRGEPSLPFETQVAGVARVVALALTAPEQPLPGGSEH